jgi:hypothetical protein
MNTDLHEALNGHDVLGARTNAAGSVVVAKPRPFWLRWRPEARERRVPAVRVTLSGALLVSASVLLAVLAVTQGYVSWHQQFAFDLAAKPGQPAASALEAIGLDSAAVIFAILGVALARLGRAARIERVLVALCALGSMLMNLLGADLGSPRSVAVYVMPPVLFAAGADRLIAVIRRSALGPVADAEERRSAWRVVAVAALYGLRFALAPPSTAVGVRRLVLAATPLPSPGSARAIEGPALEESGDLKLRPARQPVTPGRDGTKTSRLLALAGERHDLAVVPLGDVSAIATALAPEAALHPSTARRVLLGHVRALQNGATS